MVLSLRADLSAWQSNYWFLWIASSLTFLAMTEGFWDAETSSAWQIKKILKTNSEMTTIHKNVSDLSPWIYFRVFYYFTKGFRNKFGMTGGLLWFSWDAETHSVYKLTRLINSSVRFASSEWQYSIITFKIKVYPPK